jgi:hypothetical protein
VAASRLSIVTCGAAGSASSRMLAANAAKSASLAASRAHPRGQAAPQGGGVGPHPDQAHGAAAEVGDPRPPAAGVVDLPGERGRQQDRAAVAPDLASRRGHPAVLVHLDVIVVPRALALTRRPPGRGQGGGHERAVHRVLVQQRGHRPQAREQDACDRGLAGPRRAGHYPRVRGLSRRPGGHPRVHGLSHGLHRGSRGRHRGSNRWHRGSNR